jgi:catechol 2,3-dioxygenase-like lactoylglutathione lyase family enzyme
MHVAQIRIARPTDRLAAVVRFYRDAFGLEVVYEFAGHAGYDGVMLALPGRRDHLEFTAHVDGSPCPAPSRENLLVFYLPDAAERDALVARISSFGHLPVEFENPYWRERGAIAFADPDGWHVVVFPGSGLSGESLDREPTAAAVGPDDRR